MWMKDPVGCYHKRDNELLTGLFGKGYCSPCMHFCKSILRILITKKHVWNGKDHFSPNLGHKTFFGGLSLTRFETLSEVATLCNIKGNEWCYLDKMKKNIISDLIWDTQYLFSWISPLLIVRQSCKLSFYALSRKTNEPNLKKWQKTLFWTWFCPVLPKFGHQNNFGGFYLP